MRSVAVAVLAAVALAACGGSSAAPADDPLAAGREVYTRSCSVCHGATGTGGVGPALTGVLETFPACADQLHWIRLGSQRWKDEVGPSYGALDREVAGAMPSFEATLTADELVAVATFERVRYGGGEIDGVVADCGAA